MRKAEAAAAALAAAAAAALGVTYKLAFYSRPGHDEPYRLPRGEQYLAGPRAHALADTRASTPWSTSRCISPRATASGSSAATTTCATAPPLQIEFHGYRGSALRDFCGGDALARSLGMNTLLVDERAHGRSGGTHITFGVRERRDVPDLVRVRR